MTSRQDQIEQAIECGDVSALRRMVEWGRCGCVGPRDNEPLCPCKMTEKLVRETVSYAALKHNRIVRLRT